MRNKELFKKARTIAWWAFLFALLIYWISNCVACTTIDTSQSFWADPPGKEPHSGMVKENPSASVNPNIVIERRCFKTFKTDEEFKANIKKRWPGKRIEWIEAANDGLNWYRGNVYEAVIYLEES